MSTLSIIALAALLVVGIPVAVLAKRASRLRFNLCYRDFALKFESQAPAPVRRVRPPSGMTRVLGLIASAVGSLLASLVRFWHHH